MNVYSFDHLVIGSGLAGLTYALLASEHGSVAVLTKAAVSEANTAYAQGGIAAAIGEADSWELHEADTLIAGAGLCDPAAVRFLVQQAPSAIEWLQSLGARFDISHGDLSLGREGGHSRNRIVHHLDKTGWEVERTMTEAVRRHPRIQVFEHTFVTSLCMSEGRCVGAEAKVDVLGERRFLAGAVLLATGGAGMLYQHTTNPSVATADGIALASSAGAAIENMEFMQFHPTTLYHPQLRSFLITEAVRGAGGTLRNHLGHRFMYDYDKRLELAPRDVVARAIEAEMKKLQTWCVYLDIAHLPSDEVLHEFPTIAEKLKTVNIAMDRDWIPVVPAQHYSCGGVRTDLDAQTSLPGLFAAGEVACTGVHGANRLASNSLLEALVFSRAAAAKTVAARAPSALQVESNPVESVTEADSIHIRRALRKNCTDNAGITRSNRGLQEGMRVNRALIEQYSASARAPFSQHALETHNLLVAAGKLFAGALERRENVGLHYNVDLP